MFPKPGSTCARLNEVFARSWAPDARGREAFRNENLAALRDGIAEARGKAVGLVMVWDPLQCRVNHLSEGMTLPLGVTVEEVARPVDAHGAETFRHVRESRGVTPDRESVIARDLRGDGCARRRETEPVLGSRSRSCRSSPRSAPWALSWSNGHEQRAR